MHKVHQCSLLQPICWRHFYLLFQLFLYKDYSATLFSMSAWKDLMGHSWVLRLSFQYFVNFLHNLVYPFCSTAAFVTALLLHLQFLLFTWQQGAILGWHEGSLTKQEDLLVQQQGYDLSPVSKPQTLPAVGMHSQAKCSASREWTTINSLNSLLF